MSLKCRLFGHQVEVILPAYGGIGIMCKRCLCRWNSRGRELMPLEGKTWKDYFANNDYTGLYRLTPLETGKFLNEKVVVKALISWIARENKLSKIKEEELRSMAKKNPSSFIKVFHGEEEI